MNNRTDEEEWAIFLAAVCGQTYTQFANAEGAFVVPADFSAVHSFQAKSMGNVRELFGFILESPQEIIVAWRGSISTNDWLSNMNAAQKPFQYIKEPCLTHRGFTDIYASAREAILSVLGTLSPEKTLFVTGHSLGGALATLCALDVAANSAFTARGCIPTGLRVSGTRILPRPSAVTCAAATAMPIFLTSRRMFRQPSTSCPSRRPNTITLMFRPLNPSPSRMAALS